MPQITLGSVVVHRAAAILHIDAERLPLADGALPIASQVQPRNATLAYYQLLNPRPLAV